MLPAIHWGGHLLKNDVHDQLDHDVCIYVKHHFKYIQIVLPDELPLLAITAVRLPVPQPLLGCMGPCK